MNVIKNVLGLIGLVMMAVGVVIFFIAMIDSAAYAFLGHSLIVAWDLKRALAAVAYEALTCIVVAVGVSVK